MPSLGHTPIITVCQTVDNPEQETQEIVYMKYCAQSEDHPQQVANIPDPNKYLS